MTLNLPNDWHGGLRLLALDTASDACSVALLIDGIIIARNQLAPREHGNLILAQVAEVLAEAGVALESLNAIAFGRGPGSFTGLRVAAGTAQGLAFGANLPVLPVSNLAILAQAAFLQQGARQVAVAIDARMDEVYWGLYQADDQGIVQLIGEESVGAPQLVSAPDFGAWQGAGSGWQSYAERLEARCSPRVQPPPTGQLPDAADMLPLAVHQYRQYGAISPELAIPVYLRDRVTS